MTIGSVITTQCTNWYHVPEHLTVDEVLEAVEDGTWENIGKHGDVVWDRVQILEHSTGRVLHDSAPEENLFQFEVHYFDDTENYELCCIECGEHLCDVEDDDSLHSLVAMGRDHKCPDAEDMKPTMGWQSCRFEFEQFDAAGSVYRCIIHDTEQIGMDGSCENAGAGDVDLPEGYRWANADESEEYLRNPYSMPTMIVVKRTVDREGKPYTQGEADLALPIEEDK